MSDVQENHSTALYFKTQTTDFSSSFLTILQKKKKNHILHSSFLIAWPLACEVQKRGKNMHIEEELCTKLFYYVYLCKWHIRLFKKVSVAPPFIALWSVFPPCSMHDEWQRTGSVIGFIQTYIRGESMGVSLFFSDSCQSLKWRNVEYCRVLTAAAALVLCHCEWTLDVSL